MGWFDKIDFDLSATGLNISEEELKEVEVELNKGSSFGPKKMPEGFHEGVTVREVVPMVDKDGVPYTKYNDPTFLKYKVVFEKEFINEAGTSEIKIQNHTIEIPTTKIKDSRGKIYAFKRTRDLLVTLLNAQDLSLPAMVRLFSIVRESPELLHGLRCNIKVAFPEYPNACKYVKGEDKAWRLLEFIPGREADVLKDIPAKTAEWVETDIVSEDYQALEMMAKKANEEREQDSQYKIVHKAVQSILPSALNELTEDHQRLVATLAGKMEVSSQPKKEEAKEPVEEAPAESKTKKYKF